MSQQRKSAAVLRLLQGEDLETVSRSLGVQPGGDGRDPLGLARSVSCRRRGGAEYEAGEAALSTKPASGEELESERLKAKLGAALIERDLLREKIALLEANRPLAHKRRAP